MIVVASCLWNLIRGHPLRLCLFAAVAFPKNAAGSSLLYVEVSHGDLNKYLAHAVNFPAVAAIGFVTSIILWWTRRTPVKKVWRQFTKVELGMFCAGQALFAVLTGGIGMQYMHASVVNMLALGLLHYILLNKKVFIKVPEIETV